MTEQNPPQGAISRRDVFRYGLGASTLVAMGPLLPAVAGATTSAPPATSSATRLARVTPKKGGTLKFARSVAPTTLDPANTIIAGDIYTLDKIFEPLYITNPAGELVPWLATGYVTSNGSRSGGATRCEKSSP